MSEQRPVALGIQTPEQLGAGQGGFGGQNPLQMFNTLSEIQSRTLQQQNAMRTLQARDQIGEIFATSSPDQLSTNLARSPAIAYFPEIAGIARNMDVAATEINARQDQMANTASEAWLKSVYALAGDPNPSMARYTDLTRSIANRMSNPTAKNNFLKYAGDQTLAIMAGLPYSDAEAQADPQKMAANAQQIRHNIIGQTLPTIGGPEGALNYLLGGPVTWQDGRPMMRPLLGGGGFVQAPVTGPAGGNAPGTTIPPATPGTTAPAPGAVSEGKTWGDLTGASLDKPLPPNPVTGEVRFQPAVQQRVEERLRQFGDSVHGDTADYRNSQRTIMNADYIRDVFDQLQRTGGFLTAGPTLPERMQLLRSWNTIRGALGLPGTDIPQEASFTDLQKLQVQQGFSALNQVFGMGREAEMTVQAGLRSVPGVENTFLSGQLVNRTIEAFAQRAMKRFEFMDDFQSKNFGSLNGAEEAFNRLYPANTLAQQVMSEFGLGKNGFTGATRAETIDNIGKALSKGYLTPLEATNLKRGLPADYKPTQTPQPGGGVEIPMPGQPGSAPGAAVR